MSSFILAVIKLGNLNNQMFTYTITLSGVGQKQEVLCEIFYPLDPEKMEQRVSTQPQNTDLFNFTASQKTAEEIETHKEELGAELLSIGEVIPNAKIHSGVVSLIFSITSKFGLLSPHLLQNFPYLWQEDAEFHFKLPVTNESQIVKFFEALK